MIAEQRLNEILQILTEQEFVEVADLSARLNVSTMTIRRDLQKLSKMNLIQRRYGGAMLVADISSENDYSYKKTQHQASKQKLAQIALAQIHDNDILFLDAGTTTYELSVLLQQRQNLTIITNDIAIATDLCKKDIDVILLGGSLQKATLSTLGPITIDYLKHFRVTSAFLGANAISAGFDVHTPTIEKAYLKKAALQIAQKSYLMVDNSKFNSYALNRFASLSDFTGVITDRLFSSDEQHRLSNLFVNILSE